MKTALRLGSPIPLWGSYSKTFTLTIPSDHCTSRKEPKLQIICIGYQVSLTEETHL